MDLDKAWRETREELLTNFFLPPSLPPPFLPPHRTFSFTKRRGNFRLWGYDLYIFSNEFYSKSNVLPPLPPRRRIPEQNKGSRLEISNQTKKTFAYRSRGPMPSLDPYPESLARGPPFFLLLLPPSLHRGRNPLEPHRYRDRCGTRIIKGALSPRRFTRGYYIQRRVCPVKAALNGLAVPPSA